MSQYFQGPELMTLLSWAFLCLITVLLMSHAIAIFLGGDKGMSLEIDAACRKLVLLSSSKVEEAERLEASLVGQTAEVVDSETRGLRSEAERRPGPNPGESLPEWFDRQVPGLGCFVERILERKRSSGGSGKDGADPGSAILSREAYEYKWRLKTMATISPLAGMAPTMSGTMEFLRDYSSSISEGSDTLPLSGLNTALGTTWWGCCLAILSVILLSIVLKRNIPKVREMVQAKERQIRSACSSWKVAERQVDQIEKGRNQDV